MVDETCVDGGLEQAHSRNHATHTANDSGQHLPPTVNSGSVLMLLIICKHSSTLRLFNHA